MTLYNRNVAMLEAELQNSLRTLNTMMFLYQNANSVKGNIDVSTLPTNGALKTAYVKCMSVWSKLEQQGISFESLIPVFERSPISYIDGTLSRIGIDCTDLGGKSVIRYITNSNVLVGAEEWVRPGVEPEEIVDPDEHKPETKPTPVVTDKIVFEPKLAQLVSDQFMALSKKLNCPAMYKVLIDALVADSSGSVKAALILLRERKP